MPVDVQLVLGGRVDVADWSRRHAAGAVPDAVPYGLHRLEPHGYRLSYRGSSWASTPPGRVLRGVVRRVLGGYDWALTATPRSTADVVLSWDERAGAPLALRHGRHQPVVTNVIWATDAPSAVGDRAVGAGLRRARGVFVHSSAQVGALRERFGLAAAAVHPIALGIDADFFTAAEWSQADPDLVVAVGNDRHRDWPTLLDAYSRLRRVRPSTRLTIVSRSVGADLTRGIEGVRVISALGHRPLRELLARSSVCAVLTRPNLHVSGATATLEALATSRPVVATGNPGMSDYRSEAMTLVPVGDGAAAAAAMLASLEDPVAAAEVGAIGRGSVDRDFTSAGHAARLAEVLDGVLR